MTLAASRLIVATGLALACASLAVIALPSLAGAQEATPPQKPDYEALYKRANEAAAQWKLRAERADAQVARLQAQARRQSAPPADAPKAAQASEYEILNLPFGKKLNLSGWGGPDKELVFFLRTTKEDPRISEVVAFVTDNTRVFTDTTVSTVADVDSYGVSAGSTIDQRSYSPTDQVAIDKLSPLLVPGMKPLYRVFEAGRVSIYYVHLAPEVKGVKIAIKRL